jgi:hypothetical protein
MTQDKLKQKLCDMVMQFSDAGLGEYSNIFDAVDDLFKTYKNSPKNPLQKSRLSGLIFGEIDNIITTVEQNWDVPVEPFTESEEQEIEDIICQLVSFITRKYDL